MLANWHMVVPIACVSMFAKLRIIVIVCVTCLHGFHIFRMLTVCAGATICTLVKSLINKVGLEKNIQSRRELILLELCNYLWTHTCTHYTRCEFAQLRGLY